jgi:acyl CoA:acetate/3-ketoacid CoA transferase beta subunit
MLRQTPRSFVERLDFRTTVGHGDGPGSRAELGFGGSGVTCVVTDLGVLEPDPETKELTLTVLHPNATPDEARAATGWELRSVRTIACGRPPADDELAVLRELQRADAQTVAD